MPCQKSSTSATSPSDRPPSPVWNYGSPNSNCNKSLVTAKALWTSSFPPKSKFSTDQIPDLSGSTVLVTGMVCPFHKLCPFFSNISLMQVGTQVLEKRLLRWTRSSRVDCEVIILTKTNHTCRFYSSIMQQFTWHVAARQKPTRPSKNFKRLLERLLLFWNLISATYPQSNALQTNSRGDMVLRFLSSEDDVDPSI